MPSVSRSEASSMALRGRERSWNIKGRAAWVDPIVGGQWWLGIEFVFSADCAALFKIITE
jgi:hypothetical protein